MELLSRNYRRIRLTGFAAGLVTLLVMAWRLTVAGRSSVSPTVTNGYTWGMMALAITVLLLVWHERNRTGGYLQASKENARFIAAAETSPDAFTIMESVRDKAGEIVGFRYRYVNYHAEKLLKRPRVEVLEREMCELFATDSTRELYEKYRNVVLTGEPLGEELSIPLDNGKEMWLRRRIIKLDDGVAVTVSDVTKVKNNEERYRSLTNFSNSIFETAPVSIIETDLGGMIRAMNGAAEKLTGYTRAEVVGKVSITKLHDPDELNLQSGEDAAQNGHGLQGFRLLTAKAILGEVDERDCTYIQRDGTTLPVHVAVTAVRDGGGSIGGFIAIASDITERKQLMTYLKHMASHDQLTGLPGRLLLRESIADAIEKAAQEGRKVAVFVVDLDHFKWLNDSLGHRAGDEILVGIAERLHQSLRHTGTPRGWDTLGRLGGDEFVIVMPHIGSVSDVEACARRLVHLIASTAHVGEKEVNLTASVGVCVYPDFAGDVDTMLERADAATYVAKESGRNQYQMFADAMLKESQERMSMDSALRHALAREELFMHYQPLVSLTTGRVVGMESLLRWHHPKLGLLAPASFIPLAEETGMIVPIGEWVMKQSCLEAKSICDDLGMDLAVSVNLSPRQFEQSNLLQVIGEALESSGLPAKSLQVELTERVLMVNSASNLEKLQQIRKLGARVAIDDFGTGFCSFSYLLKYPVDRLKIDQSFILKAVSEPNAATVVRAILSMSHHLGIKVTAEGVETMDHLKILARRNCDEAQGFYFSRAVAAKDFAAVVETIHRTYDERKLAEEAKLASSEPEVDKYVN
jgi:diguanylate cyclase (GGDEF)-like protein/PAS domain S-box-containing protein